MTLGTTVGRFRGLGVVGLTGRGRTCFLIWDGVLFLLKSEFGTDGLLGFDIFGMGVVGFFRCGVVGGILWYFG